MSGDRRITDPSTTATHELTVTAVTAKKALRLTRSGSTLTVRGLAAQERVTVRRGAVVLATGRADAHGVFVVRQPKLRPGTHTVTGSTQHRTGRRRRAVGAPPPGGRRRRDTRSMDRLRR